ERLDGGIQNIPFALECERLCRRTAGPSDQNRRSDRPRCPPGRHLFSASMNETDRRESALFPEWRMETQDDFHDMSHHEFESGRLLLRQFGNKTDAACLKNTQGQRHDSAVGYKTVDAHLSGFPLNLTHCRIQMNVD